MRYRPTAIGGIRSSIIPATICLAFSRGCWARFQDLVFRIGVPFRSFRVSGRLRRRLGIRVCRRRTKLIHRIGLLNGCSVRRASSKSRLSRARRVPRPLPRLQRNRLQRRWLISSSTAFGACNSKTQVKVNLLLSIRDPRRHRLVPRLRSHRKDTSRLKTIPLRTSRPSGV